MREKCPDRISRNIPLDRSFCMIFTEPSMMHSVVFGDRTLLEEFINGAGLSPTPPAIIRFGRMW